MFKWMWNELHVFYELFYIHSVMNTIEVFIKSCNYYVIEQYRVGMAFAYNVAMTGIVKRVEM